MKQWENLSKPIFMKVPPMQNLYKVELVLQQQVSMLPKLSFTMNLTSQEQYV
jgi:hypothetical protein